jgi:hypothetical protein
MTMTGATTTTREDHILNEFKLAVLGIQKSNNEIQKSNIEIIDGIQESNNKVIASNNQLIAKLVKKMDDNHRSTQDTLAKYGQTLNGLEAEQSCQRARADKQEARADKQEAELVFIRTQLQELVNAQREAAGAQRLARSEPTAEDQQLEQSARRGAARANLEATNRALNFDAYSKPDSAVYSSPEITAKTKRARPSNTPKAPPAEEPPAPVDTPPQQRPLRPRGTIQDQPRSPNRFAALDEDVMEEEQMEEQTEEPTNLTNTAPAERDEMSRGSAESL